MQEKNKTIIVEKEVLINRANQEPLDWDYQLWHYIVLFMLAVVLTSGLVYLKRCKRYIMSYNHRIALSLQLENKLFPHSFYSCRWQIFLTFNLGKTL